MGEFTLPISISFGHCDPAAIVFYPNYFRWFDRCFHTFLAERAGGHKAICAQLGAKGIGLIDVKANFPSPAVEGDEMSLVLSIEKWSGKTLTLEYEGKVGDRAVHPKGWTHAGWRNGTSAGATRSCLLMRPKHDQPEPDGDQ